MSTVLILAAIISGLVFGAVRYCLVFPLQPHTGPLSEKTDAETVVAANCRRHLDAIASGPRNLMYMRALEAAARYIETVLGDLGYEPVAQIYDCAGHPVRNIEIVIEPKRHSTTARDFIIGAHYDSPDHSPGANDNGTGVAAALELARLLKGWQPCRHRLRIVFWVNEELPYGKTPLMGSWQHAAKLKREGCDVAGMIALETIGYFSDVRGSQRFPPPFGLIYPDTGNFIAFVGLPRARQLVGRALGAFRKHTAFPSIGGIAPGFLEGIDLSDHWAYDQHGFPALMITDTAPFRNPHYHEDDDLPSTVDCDSLARVTVGLSHMLRTIVT